MDDLNRIIAHNISTLRTSFGMTQLELAERLNYSDKLISKWERGDAAPNAQTLKQLSEIFSVSVDYLFTDHSGEEPAGGALDAAVLTPGEDPEKTIRKNHGLITAISLIGIWALSLLGFIIAWMLGSPLWQIFVYVLPVCFITLLVLNSVWYRGKHNFYIISALIASIAAVIYVSLLKYNNYWQIFLLLIPAELLVLLSTRIKLPKRRR